MRQTRSLGALVLCSICNMVFVKYIYDMVVDAQFNKFHGRSFARVLYVFLVRYIGRWLPWVLPGSTGRFYKDDVVHSHSAHGYYITHIEGGVRYICMILLITLHVKQNKTNLIKNAIHIIRELELVTLQLKDNLSDRTSKIGVRMILSKLQVRGTPCKCCSKSQQRSSPGFRLRLTAPLVWIERVCWISHYHHFFCSWHTTKHISHSCGRRSCRPGRYLSSSTHSHISEQCLATALRVSSSITTGHYVLNKDVDPKRLGSENNATKEAQQAQT